LSLRPMPEGERKGRVGREVSIEDEKKSEKRG
jgi:hypothetical protein